MFWGEEGDTGVDLSGGEVGDVLRDLSVRLGQGMGVLGGWGNGVLRWLKDVGMKDCVGACKRQSKLCINYV